MSCLQGKCHRVFTASPEAALEADRETHCEKKPSTGLGVWGEKRAHSSCCRISALKNYFQGFPWWLRWQSVCLQYRNPGFDSWVGRIPWRRKWQPAPVLLPGKSLGRRILVGYSPWGHKESDTIERLHFHFQGLR